MTSTARIPLSAAGQGAEKTAPARLEAPQPVEKIEATAVAGLETLEEPAWNRLVPEANAALTYGYLRAFEQADLDGLSSRPIVARHRSSGELLAASPGYWYDLDLASTRLPALAGAMDGLRRLWPRLLKARTLELGTPAPFTSPFMVAEQVDRGAALRAIAEAGVAEGKRGRASFLLVQNLTRADSSAVEHFSSLGFVRIPLLPTVVVSLPYSSFEEYLGSMRSQYRRRARQTLERSEGLKAEHLKEFSSLAGELARLWREIYDRAKELRRERLTPEYFAAMSELEESSVLLLRRTDGSIASFALLLDDRPWLAFLQCGFEKEAGKNEGAYFRLLYEIVRHGIENGYSHAELGMTTVTPKLDVGGVPVPLYGLIRHSNPLVHKVMDRLANGPLAPGQLEARKVFKKAPPSAPDIVAAREAGL